MIKDETYFYIDDESKKMLDEMRKEYIEEHGQVDWFDEAHLVHEENSGDDLYDLWHNWILDGMDKEDK